MLKIGLTGSIGVGKSAVAGYLRELGCDVIDADKIAHALMEPGENAYIEIVGEFGTNILAKDKTIDRAKLGSIVFADLQKLKLLNNIVHPKVIARQDKLLAALPSSAVAVVEAALMIESGSHQRFDKLIVVHCSKDIQIQRIMGRGLSIGDAMKRIAAQLSSEEKCRHADYIIDTSGTLEETRQQVRDIYNLLAGG